MSMLRLFWNRTTLLKVRIKKISETYLNLNIKNIPTNYRIYYNEHFTFFKTDISSRYAVRTHGLPVNMVNRIRGLYHNVPVIFKMWKTLFLQPIAQLAPAIFSTN